MVSAGACTRGAAILVVLLCSQVAVAWAEDDNVSSGIKCSNDMCQSQDSYSPKHFIFVHGMGGGAWFWFEIVTLLQRFGFTATAVDLTSHGIDKAIPDDITTLAQYCKPLSEAIERAPGKVILVGHSLGGGVIAYASELYSTKVSKAIYLSAVSPSYNQSMFSAFPSTTFPYLINSGYLSFNFRNGPPTPTSATLNVDALDKFYMNETPRRFVELSRALFTNTPFAPGTEVLPLTPEKFETVKRYYIRTGKDKAVLPADQDAIIAANPPEKVFCMPRGDHAVFISAPLELFKLLTCIAVL